MILNLVDEFCGMLQANTYRKTFRLDVYAALCKIAIDIACRMACGKDDSRRLNIEN